jgi:enoyl-CoA hydratase/3-hydroxyacyl-CoA dehydrogenase
MHAGPLRHPQLCIDAVEAGVRSGGRAGLRAEAEAFATAARLDVHKALVHIFFAQRATKKVKGVTDCGLKARSLKMVAVLGGGLMGSGICTALALAGFSVVLKEINQKFLDAGMERVSKNFQSRVKKDAMTKEAMGKCMALIEGTLSYDGFKKARWMFWFCATAL